MCVQSVDVDVRYVIYMFTVTGDITSSVGLLCESGFKPLRSRSYRSRQLQSFSTLQVPHLRPPLALHPTLFPGPSALALAHLLALTLHPPPRLLGTHLPTLKNARDQALRTFLFVVRAEPEVRVEEGEQQEGVGGAEGDGAA